MSQLPLEPWRIIEMNNGETLLQMTLAQIVRLLASSDTVTAFLVRHLAAKPHSTNITASHQYSLGF